MAERRSIIREMPKRSMRARKKERGRMLDELKEQCLSLNPAALRRRLTDNERKLTRLCALKE